MFHNKLKCKYRSADLNPWVFAVGSPERVAQLEEHSDRAGRSI